MIVCQVIAKLTNSMCHCWLTSTQPRSRGVSSITLEVLLTLVTDIMRVRVITTMVFNVKITRGLCLDSNREFWGNN